MQFTVRTTDRDSFINLGEILGYAMKDCDEQSDIINPKPWAVCLNGYMNNGKSLLALAIDKAFNPENYPVGLIEELSADNLIGNTGKPLVSTVVFENALGKGVNSSEEFDHEIEKFSAAYPEARVLITANMLRMLNGYFFNAAQGLDSDHLSMHIQVKQSEKLFRGPTVVTVENQALIDRIAERLKSAPKLKIA